ncbi:MAG: ATP phosphoribosyltransferase [Chloroflexota bacterium]|nr:ATP phosphoribosyltransferase [Chloroflexota bacterium]
MLRVVLPKGSLEEATFRLFAEANLSVHRGGERDYKLTMDDPRVEEVRLLRPQEIPLYIQEGYFDLGISGYDWIRETESDVVELMELEYNKRTTGQPVRIVLAVAQDSTVRRAEEMPSGSRISTEYPRLTQAFFDQLGIAVRIYPSYGATEAKVPDIVDAVVDLTETGSTLRQAGLRIVATLLESTTRLVANRESYADPQKRAEMEELMTLLRGALAARGQVLVKFNVHEDDLEEAMDIVPAAKSPTIARLYGSDYYAVESVVPKSEINHLIPQLKAQGAEDILELPILKIVD